MSLTKKRMRKTGCPIQAAEENIGLPPVFPIRATLCSPPAHPHAHASPTPRRAQNLGNVRLLTQLFLPALDSPA